MKRPTAPLFLAILIEGYVVLASELLAIRQLIPFVGSGTETVAIIICAVLLPLAVGYAHGGRHTGRVRARLVRNILVALAVLTFGLSYWVLEWFFAAITRTGIDQPIMQTACYAAVFLIYPIYLLGQTVPLISNYFPRHRISALTGRMLFYSTVGSFFGSVFSTLVLMNTIGVHATVIVTIAMLAALVLLLSRRWLNDVTVMAALCLAIAVAGNSPATMRAMHIVSDNAYNSVAIRKNMATGDKYMLINRSTSSGLGRSNERIFPYIAYIESMFINPINKPDAPPRNILVLGAGGFTVGLDDAHNHYTFVDIDPALKQVAEKHFIGAPLTANKQVVTQSARAYVHGAVTSYDLIIIDTFTHRFSAPMETTTREFLMDVKKRLNPGGIIVVNQIAQPDLSDRFSVHYDRTFASVFPVYTRQVIGDYNPWAAPDKNGGANVLYIYYQRAEGHDLTPYTDDVNHYSLDRHRD